MARDVQAIRRAVDLATSRTGDVTARDITAHNLVTGSQTIHIVNVYQAGGGTWGEAEYQAALARYLTWLAATNGRVVLRGIQRSGQQAVELSLQDVYVPLAATPCRQRVIASKGNWSNVPADKPPAAWRPQPNWASAAPSKRITMQDLLHQGDRLVLIGAPGCGKTTVLQHIAWTLAEALRTHQPDLATARLGLSGALPLPIYVPLSLYADHRAGLPPILIPTGANWPRLSTITWSNARPGCTYRRTSLPPCSTRASTCCYSWMDWMRCPVRMNGRWWRRRCVTSPTVARRPAWW